MVAPTPGKSELPSPSASSRRPFRLGDALLLVVVAALMVSAPRTVWALGRAADVLMYYREGVIRRRGGLAGAGRRGAVAADRSGDDRLGRAIGLAWVTGYLGGPILAARGL